MFFHQLDHALKLVLALTADTQRIAVDAWLNLRETVANQLLKLLSDLLRDTLLERGDLAHTHAADLFDRTEIENFERQAAAQHLGLKDIAHGGQVHLGVSCDGQLLFAERDVGLSILKIIAGSYLALSLVYRVDKLLAVELRDDIESAFGRHISSLITYFSAITITQKRGAMPPSQI